MKNKILKSIHYIILYGFPLLNIVVFYTYVGRAINKIGYIPSYNNPDPKLISGLESHRLLIYSLSNILVVTIMLVVIAFICDVIFKKKFYKNLRVHYIISFLLILLLIFAPFQTWFLD